MYPYTQGKLSMTPTPPTPYAWETAELSNDLPEQFDHHQPQRDVYSTSPRMIELQEHVPFVPSQRSHSEVPHHISPTPGPSGRGSNVVSQELVQRPYIHIDTTRHMTASGSPPSGPPSASGGHSVGPVRTRLSPAHITAAHPYRRPHSANPRRDHESNLPLRQSSYASSTSHVPALSALQTHVAPMHRTAIISPAHVIPPIPTNVTFIPRADYFFCSESRVSTALFELPGVKKSDLKIELSTCQNGVKQLSISGEARQPLSYGVVALKERKYGKFRRVLPVCADTKKEDISLDLEDGVLILRIQFGPPLESEQESEMIPIP